MGSSGNNAGYPDIAIGIDPSDGMRQATLAGLWNAAYAIGWAAGPLLGGALYGGFGFATFVTATGMLSLGYGIVMMVGAFVIVEDGVDEHTKHPVGLKSFVSKGALRDEQRPLLLAYGDGGGSAGINTGSINNG